MNNTPPLTRNTITGILTLSRGLRAVSYLEPQHNGTPSGQDVKCVVASSFYSRTERTLNDTDAFNREAKGHPLYHKRPLASRDCSPHELSTQPAMAYSIKGKHDMVGNSAVSAISPVAMFSYYGCYRSVTPKDSLIY